MNAVTRTEAVLLMIGDTSDHLIVQHFNHHVPSMAWTRITAVERNSAVNVFVGKETARKLIALLTPLTELAE